MKSLFALFVVSAFILNPSAHAQIENTTPPPQISIDSPDFKWAKDAGDFILHRLGDTYGGLEFLNSALKPGSAVRGFVGTKGELIPAFDGAGSFFPFQVELNSDGKYLVSAALVEMKPSVEDERSMIKHLRAFHFTYDNRIPNKVESLLTFDIAANTSFKTWDNGSWFGPLVDLKVGGKWVTYDLRGSRFENEQKAERVGHDATGVYADIIAGVNFDKRFLDYSLNGFAGVQYTRTGTPNDFEKNSDKNEFALKGYNSNLGGQITTRQAMVNLNFDKVVDKKKSTLGLFYEGRYFRKASLMNTFDSREMDITQLDLVTPHRVGLRFRFR